MILQVVLREARREERIYRKPPPHTLLRTSVRALPLLSTKVGPQIQRLGKMLGSALTCQIQNVIVLTTRANVVLLILVLLSESAPMFCLLLLL